MNKLTLMTLTTLLLSLAATSALAQRHGWENSAEENGRRGRHFEHLQQQLDLTPEQADEIRAILARNETERQTRREQARATRQELDTLLTAGPVNESRLRELVHKQAEQRADRLLSRQATRAAVDQVLTPEQQERHQAMQQQRIEQRSQQDCAEPRGNRRRL